MNHLLTSIDEKLLLEIFQPLTLEFQKLTGRNNFWLARRLLEFWILSEIVYRIWNSFSTHSKFTIFDLFLSALIVMIDLVTFVVIQFTIFAFEEMTRPGFRNPAQSRVVYVYLRSGFMIMGLMEATLGRWHTALSAFVLVVIFYIAACTPDPPTKSKIRVWLETIRGWLISDPLPSPA